MSPTQVLSCGTCEIFKNTYSEEHLRTTASETCSNLTHQDCPFLITYTSGSNWYICFTFCFIIYSFVCQFSLHYYWYRYNQKQSPGGVPQKGVLISFTKFTRKHLRKRLVFNEVSDLQSLTLSKKRFRPRCYLVNYASFLIKFFCKEPFRRLLLHKHSFRLLSHHDLFSKTLPQIFSGWVFSRLNL